MVLQNAGLIRYTTTNDNKTGNTVMDTLDIDGYNINVNEIESNIDKLDIGVGNVYDAVDDLNEKVHDLTNELKTTRLKLYALIATSFIFSILLFFIK